jgi:hypothetical protein
MQRDGFHALISDLCTYILQEGDQFVIVTIWVDDLLLFAMADKLIDKTLAILESKWELTNLGEPVKIVGIEITLGDHSVTISQHRYLEMILQKKGMDHANPVGMPLDNNMMLEPNLDGNVGDCSNLYARLIGELQFIANATRPNITYVISRLSAFTANSTMQHVTTLKHVLRYLSEMRSHGITYSDILDHPNHFFSYANASFANTDDYKSITSYVFKMASGVITWYSRKQLVTAMLTMEVEYITLSKVAREAWWLRNLFSELGFAQRLPMKILGDNKGSIAISKNPQFYKRAKHIGVQFHSVKEQVKEGKIVVESCRTQQQTTDVLTKALPWAKHKQHVAEMGLSSA